MIALPEALREQYLELRARNPAFSLRAYARRLRVNSGVLSAVMAGRRPVTEKWLKQIVPRMDLPPEKMLKIRGDYQLKHLSKAEVRANKAVMLLKSDEFSIIADGIHFALLSLFELRDFTPSVTWMAGRLDVPLREVKAALARLERLNLVEKKSNRWAATGKTLRTSEGVSDAAIKRFHEQRFEEAKRALYEVEVADRDFLCSTVAISTQKLPLARRLVREFLEKLEEILGEEPKNEVYRIGVQMFPVTKLNMKKDKEDK